MLAPQVHASLEAGAPRRAAAALVLSVGLLGAASCGMDVQTTRPYTPAEGVNVEVGRPAVQVRNLMILSREDGKGFLSATMTWPDGTR